MNSQRVLGRAVLTLLATFAFSAPLGVSAEHLKYPQRRPIRFSSARDMNPLPESFASFDCRAATSAVDRMICANAPLASADGDLGFTYAMAIYYAQPAERPNLRAGQRAWLRRRDQCGDVACLQKLYEQRSHQLDAIYRAQAPRRRVRIVSEGQCETARIVNIAGRLQAVEDRPPDGISLTYSDGVYTTAYDRNPSVLRSRVGDRVRICLAEIPKSCPTGDERGRIYETFNLRTRVRWKMPNAEHGCGGA